MIVLDILDKVKAIEDIVDTYRNSDVPLGEYDIDRAIEFLEEYKDELLSMKVSR